ncbi:methyltransferase [Cellulomonas fimi]|uniref:methyltransferase n=1 Tax=Cellulomonas fimi TaxID=1708 RepID=UPI002358709F|nr:methyltransferase [Cellulomonas fimi]
MTANLPTTPLRALPATERDGVRVVRETGQAWLDGSEDELFRRLTTSGLPLDSLSDELFATATSWPERYHLSPSRANVIRALDLPADARVLEIGAGCGAITRYLGETCALVDALEPTFPRARVAAARTADLPGVVVTNAEVSDLPDEAAYDLVVVVGVLEYVGGGGDDPQPYVTFLDELRRRLRPGGVLVLAIENPLGVKYLAGAPEDHSGQVFHSVEGYPVDGPARTFTRRRLAELARLAGFGATHVLGAFPDYKLTRMVLDDALLERAPGLAVAAQHFPSPDWVLPRPVLLDEALVWGQLVEAGVGAEFSNSFLLLAGTGDDAPELWGGDKLAEYFSISRGRPYQVAKRVAVEADEVTITSRRLGSGSHGDLTVREYTEPWLAGASLVDLALQEPGRLDDLVRDWVRLLGERVDASADGTPFDVLPHNVHYTDGQATVIDDEWRSASLTRRDVVLRGALLLARDLLDRAPASTWGATTAYDLAERVATVAGEKVGRGDLEAAVVRESELQAEVGGAARGSDRFDRIRSVVEEDLRRRLDEPRAGVAPTPVWQTADDQSSEATETRDLLWATGAQLDEARRELAEARREAAAARARVAEIEQGRAYRAASGVRRLLGRG